VFISWRNIAGGCDQSSSHFPGWGRDWPGGAGSVASRLQLSCFWPEEAMMPRRNPHLWGRVVVVVEELRSPSPPPWLGGKVGWVGNDRSSPTVRRSCHNHQWSYIDCRKMGGTRDYHGKRSKSDWGREISHGLSHMQNLDLKKWQECKTGTISEWGLVRVEGEKTVGVKYFIYGYENRIVNPV
jgi:hypothetical protein